MNKYLIFVGTDQYANIFQEEIINLTNWSQVSIVSYNIPLLSSLTIGENIALPFSYLKNIKLGKAEQIVYGLLEKFKLEEKINLRQEKLNEYELLIVKFLRAIMQYPEKVVFIMPHQMIPTEEYRSFIGFIDSLTDFDITVIEHEKYADDFLDKNFMEISYEKWLTHVLKI